MPTERQPALPPLDQLVPTDQLREAEKLSPSNLTPAQRAERESTSPTLEQPGPATSEPGTTGPATAEPAPPTQPFDPTAGGTPPPGQPQ